MRNEVWVNQKSVRGHRLLGSLRLRIPAWTQCALGSSHIIYLRFSVVAKGFMDMPLLMFLTQSQVMWLGRYPPVATNERRRLSGRFLNLKSFHITHVLAKVQGVWQCFFILIWLKGVGQSGADVQQSRARMKVADNTPNFYAPRRSAVL